MTFQPFRFVGFRMKPDLYREVLSFSVKISKIFAPTRKHISLFIGHNGVKRQQMCALLRFSVARDGTKVLRT